MKKPIDQPAFWRDRLDQAKQNKRIRDTVFRTTDKDWQKLNQDHKRIVDKEIKHTDKVLDAGCGYGRGCEFLPGVYVGVDSSPDLIKEARSRYTNKMFMIENLKGLPFPDNKFDWAVCISIKVMIIENLGYKEWELIQRELLRVSKQILCLEYGQGDTVNTPSSVYTIIKSS